MKEEIQRISQMVAEGKISPKDAADLIDAFYASERSDASSAAAEPNPSGTQNAPPPPPPGAEIRDPLKQLIDSVEKMTREGIQSVNWNEVARQARISAEKGLEVIRTGVEEVSKGKVNLGWLNTSATREFDIPLTIPEGKVLMIEGNSGNIRVTGNADHSHVLAVARFHAASYEEAKAKADAYSFVVEEADHAVMIRPTDMTGTTVDLEVQFAGAHPVEIKSLSGDVRVTDTGSSCRVQLKSGDLNLSGLNGIVDVSSHSGDTSISRIESPQVTIDKKSGDLTIVGLRGNLNARTASGDISIADSVCRVVSLESISGDTSYQGISSASEAINIRTVSGDASLSLVETCDFRVSLSTMRGDVSADITLDEDSRSENRVTGRMGSGTGTLDVSAINGDIHVYFQDAVV